MSHAQASRASHPDIFEQPRKKGIPHTGRDSDDPFRMTPEFVAVADHSCGFFFLRTARPSALTSSFRLRRGKSRLTALEFKSCLSAFSRTRNTDTDHGSLMPKVSVIIPSHNRSPCSGGRGVDPRPGLRRFRASRRRRRIHGRDLRGDEEMRGPGQGLPDRNQPGG